MHDMHQDVPILWVYRFRNLHLLHYKKCLHICLSGWQPQNLCIIRIEWSLFCWDPWWLLLLLAVASISGATWIGTAMGDVKGRWLWAASVAAKIGTWKSFLGNQSFENLQKQMWRATTWPASCQLGCSFIRMVLLSTTKKNKWSTGGIQMPNSSMHNAWNRAKRAWQARVFATDVQFCAWMIHYVLKGFEHCSPCSPLWNGLVEVLISSRMFSGYTPTVYFWQCSAVTFGCLNVFPDVRFEMTRHEAWDILHGVVFVNIF